LDGRLDAQCGSWIVPVSDRFLCQVCGEDRLEVVRSFSALPRVTSDCKPWPAGGTLAICGECGAAQKLPDAAWREEIGRIYRDYEIYQLSSGVEQVIFDETGAAAPRSRKLVDFLATTISLPPRGKLIDIGCGNGSALRSFSGIRPGWSLYGSELSAAALPRLRELRQFVELFTCDLAEIGERFDIVTMIHSLEHMPRPARALEQALRLLAPGGVLFVEVPDVETSPFDLVVADHLMHFSRATLRHLGEKGGCDILVARNDVLPKEITFMARSGAPRIPTTAGAHGSGVARRHAAWLEAIVAAARASARGASRFGIFGTSISAMWLYGALKDDVALFVDEDDTRIGRSIEGRPILAPADTPRGATIFVPLVPSIAARVIARLAPLDIDFVAPPPT
jgi:SAM-dependent methyltransferase